MKPLIYTITLLALFVSCKPTPQRCNELYGNYDAKPIIHLQDVRIVIPKDTTIFFVSQPQLKALSDSAHIPNKFLHITTSNPKKSIKLQSDIAGNLIGTITTDTMLITRTITVRIPAPPCFCPPPTNNYKFILLGVALTIFVLAITYLIANKFTRNG